MDAWRSPTGCTDDDREPGAFLSWCAQKKILWEKCELGNRSSTGRCVLAKEYILEGEIVVEVPDDAVLLAENTPTYEVLSEWGLTKPADDPLLEVQGLILAVMVEKVKGGKSQWAPYLQLLPDSLDHLPLFWSPEELERLRGTACYDKMRGRVQCPNDAPTRVDELFDDIAVPFFDEHPDLLATHPRTKRGKRTRQVLGQHAPLIPAAVP